MSGASGVTVCFNIYCSSGQQEWNYWLLEMYERGGCESTCPIVAEHLLCELVAVATPRNSGCRFWFKLSLPERILAASLLPHLRGERVRAEYMFIEAQLISTASHFESVSLSYCHINASVKRAYMRLLKSRLFVHNQSFCVCLVTFQS